ncbi:uncharacterized protein [Nicotiana tomentosiformis]|uniref:uncharacterized protein isoform X3 n=1 Tax=Nicotiana tomentosiformis TaxID=4098 RepID=UPI0008781DCE
MSPFFIKLTGLKQRPQCTDGIVNILLHEIFSLISHYSIGREESHTKCSQVTSLYSGTSTIDWRKLYELLEVKHLVFGSSTDWRVTVLQKGKSDFISDGKTETTVDAGEDFVN